MSTYWCDCHDGNGHPDPECPTCRGTGWYVDMSTVHDDGDDDEDFEGDDDDDD